MECSYMMILAGLPRTDTDKPHNFLSLSFHFHNKSETKIDEVAIERMFLFRF